MLENKIYQWTTEVIHRLARKISRETNYHYKQVLPVIDQQYAQICCETAIRATKRFALAKMFLVRACFLLLLGFILYVVTKTSVISFFASSFIWFFVLYFSALKFPVFRKKAEETNIKAAGDVMNVMFSLRKYLNRGYRITGIITDSVIQTLGFWAVNGIIAIFGAEYLGIKTALYFGILIGILNAFIDYYNGWVYYQKVKKAVVKRLSLQSRENAEYEVLN